MNHHGRGNYGLLFGILMFLAEMTSAQDKDKFSCRFMFYNSENLFDVFDDSLKNDNDFLPGGLMRWSRSRYNKKINSLSKTIIAAGAWQPPVLIGLCEVENRDVLEDLVFGTGLSKFKFNILHVESPDERGIDVAMLYQKDIVNIIYYSNLIPETESDEVFTSRGVLYSKLVINGDTIHLFLNHWPSRRGGVLASEQLRIKVATMVKQKADSISRKDGNRAKIILMGDFNCTPDDPVIRRLSVPTDSIQHLINLSNAMANDGLGTYRYQGTWEVIDQIIVSESLLESGSGLFTDKKSVGQFKADFLLINDPVYPGLMPYATYRGYRYQGGFSDHLPVLIDFHFK